MNPTDLDTITLCPERIELKKFLANKEHGLEKKEYNAILKSLRERYKLAFHNYFAEMHPYLRFEIGEEKVFWNYKEDEGIYEEVTSTTVQEWILKLMIAESLQDAATTSFAKNVAARYRACYEERGNTYDSFDDQREWFHCKNGWIHTHTLEFAPHAPERLSRRVSAVAYDKEATCPVYDTFLDEQLQIPKDQVRVIDQFSGLLLTPDITKQKMLVIIGKPGCGKSTLLDAWSDVLGDLSTEKKLSEISNDAMIRFSGGDLVDKTLCWFDEVNVTRSEMGNQLNTLITGQTIRVERKGINGISKPQNTTKSILTANSLPRSAEIGIYRRMLLIYFNYSFTDNLTDNQDVREILRKEAPGILNRMLIGLKDLTKQKNFTVMEGHDELIEEYKTESNTVAEFLDEYFEYDEKAPKLESKILLDTYKNFSGDKYSQGLTPQRFGVMISQNGLMKFSKIQISRGSKGKRMWAGLRLRDTYEINNFGLIVGKDEY